ncbi:hypothetical protein HPB51_003006 [Rhipicephalus microplus]|uniref:Uncharacterized protein n=1 Tax=Rhipicephalus microplus TaxID=6941 RepID=A0A9J6DTA6_RHIMP|nr:hypothetical protein HPB51_003006 [Rhipicephalus microplus]
MNLWPLQLQARMMGQTNIALVTFEGLKDPRYVRFYGAELHCYHHCPRQVVCKICLKLSHRDDHCPTPDVICPTCGTDNPTLDYTVSSKTAETRHLRTPTKAEESRSKSRSESRHKSKARYKFRTRLQSRTRLKLRSCSKSHYCSSKESRHPLETRAPSPSTRHPYEKALQSKPVGKEVRAFSEQQRAPERNAIKVAPRELGQVEIPPQPAPSSQSLPTAFPQITKSPTPDPLAEIARLRRDVEARCERLKKQMNTLVAEMGTSMQAALDRIERRMEIFQIEMIERVQSCIERTLARTTAVSATETKLDQISRPSISYASARSSHPYTRPSVSSRDEDGVT